MLMRRFSRPATGAGATIGVEAPFGEPGVGVEASGDSQTDGSHQRNGPRQTDDSHAPDTRPEGNATFV
jgi:hypothetical protein